MEKGRKIKRIVSFSAAAVCMLASLRIAPSTEMSVYAATNLSATEITKEMGIGWNLGNTLDAYGGTATGLATETSWGNPKTTKAMIDAVKAKGFNTVRIPTTWFPHLDGSNNIDPEWMARVKEVVDYCIDDDMYVILNLHHEEWVDRPDLGSAYNEMQPKFTKIWTQISDAFKDYDQHLIFESMNEPRAKGTDHEWWGPQQSEVDTINKLNQDFVKIIRGSSSENNKNRLLMIPGYCASSDATMYSKIQVPSDNMVAVSIHAYVPYDFTMNTAVSDHSTFSEAYSVSLSQTLEGIRSTFIAKGIPVVIGEFGTSNFGNTEARVKWADQYLSTTSKYGIPCVLWDNNVINAPSSAGECHGYLNRSDLSWYPESEPVVKKMMEVVGANSSNWGEDKQGTKYDHQELSAGKTLTNTKVTIKAADAPDGNCTTFDGSWAQIEGGEVAIKYTGDTPILAVVDADWDNWTEIKPYTVDNENGIAYYSADHIKAAWSGSASDIAHLFARTDGTTTIEAVYALGGASSDTKTTASTTTTVTTTKNNDTTTTTTNTQQSSGKGFYVENQKIMDANGNEFIMRGINVAHAWYQSNTEQTLKAAAAKGCNTVRIVCADGGQWTKTSAAELEKIIGWCKENKLICVLEAHDATGSDKVEDVVAAAKYWAENKDILNKNADYVILNIANEWVGTWDSATWAKGSSEAIKVVRDAGIKNMIMIDSAGWGQYGASIKEKGAEVFASDPDKNTVFSIHFYGTAGKNAQTIKENIDGALTSGAPVLAGEFGYTHSDGDVDEIALMNYCEEKGLGYLAWSWKGNGGGVEYLDLVSDWDGNSQTEWGDIFFGAMKNSKPASVFGGSTNNTTTSATNTTTTTTTTTTTSTTSSGAGKAVTLYGDANCDGIVNVADAVLIMQSLANPSAYGLTGSDANHITEQGYANADCESAGNGVTNKDALAIQKLRLDLIASLPAII